MRQRRGMRLGRRGPGCRYLDASTADYTCACCTGLLLGFLVVYLRKRILDLLLVESGSCEVLIATHTQSHSFCSMCCDDSKEHSTYVAGAKLLQVAVKPLGRQCRW